MPKLDPTHIHDRLRKRIEQLEAGETLAARDINALLTPKQQKELKEAWAKQQQLRKSHKTKAAAERDGVIWKTIREVRLDVFRNAFEDAQLGLPGAFKKLLHDVEVRSARIYMAAAAKAMDENNRFPHVAANNALTRAGLRRLDGQNSYPGAKRDKEVREMEDKIRDMQIAKMTTEEREQYELVKAHEESIRKQFGGLD
jgi:hypothetical protein